ncbi:YybH family protein [Nonomuraea indica]|uniref:YybH family protein n=1 Tax=Nonomuraea indica TaxID=1581193 RepID=UPI000C7D8524|nr:nuclear transport factor 2 family protein [Nonomuraea indica]
MPTRHETDETAIRRHIDKIVEGIRAKDLQALERLYAPDVVSFDVEPPLQHVGVEAKAKNWANVFGTVAKGMWVRATFGLRKIDGEWLIVHDQVSVPFDVRSGRGVTDLEP